MSFIYETHLHTYEGSLCGRSHGEDYVPYYKALGYDGIIVTDHFYLGNTRPDRSLPWEDWVHEFCAGYRNAKAAGDKEGLKVFFGWETSYSANDFLIYGLDENWLMKHPEVTEWDEAEQFKNITAAGGMVIQAHPFRVRPYVETLRLQPFHCEGWEIGNANNPPEQNLLAYRYAKNHHMHMTSGSDIHKTGGILTETPFGVVSEKELQSIEDYMMLVRHGEYSLHMPEDYFDGVPIVEPSIPIYLFNENHIPERLPKAPE